MLLCLAELFHVFVETDPVFANKLRNTEVLLPNFVHLMPQQPELRRVLVPEELLLLFELAVDPALDDGRVVHVHQPRL